VTRRNKAVLWLLAGVFALASELIIIGGSAARLAAS